MNPLRIHAKIESSRVNGPGNRAVIWTQGCVGMNCPGCWNPETHSPDSGAVSSDLDLLSWLEPIQTAIEGITISGGEPMQQPAALFSLLEAIRTAFPHLSIGMFSGYSERELDKSTIWPHVRARLDFAVLGRYNALQPAADPLVTSSNQSLRLFSDRYTPADFRALSVEVTIDELGLTQITGFPLRGFLK